MNRSRVTAVVRKDWLELLRNRQALLPLLVVPLIFVVVFPAAILVLARSGMLAEQDDLQELLAIFPSGMIPETYNDTQAAVYLALTYMLGPMFLIIPIMLGSVTASSSFVGEKERRTMEGLLYTPITNRELVLAKVLVSLIPSVVCTWLASIICAVIVNGLGWPLFNEWFFPNLIWLLMILVLSPLLALLSVLLIVAVSQRSTTMQSAQSASVFLILPVIALIVSQAAGLVFFDAWLILAASVVVFIGDVVLFWLIATRVNREQILLRM
jgi:ABC-2 type transport system permease protein